MRELMLKLLTYEPFEKISGDTVPTKAEVDELYEKQKIDEYSRAVTPQVRQAGNRLSGLAETAYASLLA